MPTLVMLMIAGACAFAWWSAARAAAETATRLGRDACRAAGVQLLDQSVHANGLRFRRRQDGKLGFERSFRFDWSDDGVERHVGHLVLREGELVAFSGPVRGATVVPFGRGE